MSVPDEGYSSLLTIFIFLHRSIDPIKVHWNK
jgi:hypothetical protein